MVTPGTFDVLVAEDRPRTSGLGSWISKIATASHASRNTYEMAKMTRRWSACRRSVRRTDWRRHRTAPRGPYDFTAFRVSIV
jgi:hypothetical protein